MRTVNERTATLADTMRELSDNVGGIVRVAMPGIIKSWDKATQTASVQLAIREKIIKEGAEKDIDIPLLVDVPVIMPRSGGYMLAFAPQAGDEVLVIFADLCIDAWWQSGGVQNQDEVRRHEFSDGFAVFGTWNQKRKPSLPDSGVRLQTDSGGTYVSVTSGHIELHASSVTVNGRQVQTI